MADGVWGQMTPFRLTGLNSEAAPPQGAQPIPGVARAAGPGLMETARPFSPDSPLFWFGLIAAATVGLVAVSTTVRLGPLKGSVGLGK